MTKANNSNKAVKAIPENFYDQLLQHQPVVIFHKTNQS